ncbi:MAG: M28 family peptidase [Oscillospiraceae bacterium]|nr:M28 family peptidase [Oscillospiraceae bacterium]
MTGAARTVLEQFQIRKTKGQKVRFRAWLCGELEAEGYAPRVESTFAANNVVLGDVERAEVILTAHYDTCAVLPFPNFITPRKMLWYVLYQAAIVILMLAFAAALAAAGVFLMRPLELEPLGALLGGYAGVFFFCWWMLFGKANRHTVNDNTSGVLTLMETALTLPEELRERVCFVFFDNEERGLFGSSAFGKKHKEALKDKLLLNFDCVSDGDYIQFFPNKTVKQDTDTLQRLERAFRPTGEKQVEVVTGPGFYPSDQRCAPKGVGVCALKKSKVFGYYMDRIHTGRDTVLDERNIELLRAGVLRLLEG